MSRRSSRQSFEPEVSLHPTTNGTIPLTPESSSTSAARSFNANANAATTPEPNLVGEVEVRSADDTQILAILAHMSQQQSIKSPHKPDSISSSQAPRPPLRGIPTHPSPLLSRNRPLPPNSGTGKTPAPISASRYSSDPTTPRPNPIASTSGSQPLASPTRTNSNGSSSSSSTKSGKSILASGGSAKGKAKVEERRNGSVEIRGGEGDAVGSGDELAETDAEGNLVGGIEKDEKTKEEDWVRTRKDNHKEVERRRRETINDGINDLRKIVPGCEKNKGSILQRAVQYIQQLKEAEASNIEKWTLEKILSDQALKERNNECEGLREDLESVEKELEEVGRWGEGLKRDNQALREKLAAGGKREGEGMQGGDEKRIRRM